VSAKQTADALLRAQKSRNHWEKIATRLYQALEDELDFYEDEPLEHTKQAMADYKELLKDQEASGRQ